MITGDKARAALEVTVRGAHSDVEDVYEADCADLEMDADGLLEVAHEFAEAMLPKAARSYSRGDPAAYLLYLGWVYGFETGVRAARAHDLEDRTR